MGRAFTGFQDQEEKITVVVLDQVGLGRLFCFWGDALRLILSRKGFDSSSGGCPNPIFPDGSMLALPIPDNSSLVTYSEVMHENQSIAPLVSQLTKGRIKPTDGAHLDPDLSFSAYSRQNGWMPVLGQHGAAQGHLRNQGVQKGDLFLFFGLFNQVEKVNQCWQFVKGSRPRHVMWGWMSVGSVCDVANLKANQKSWLAYHPHLQFINDINNRLYFAAESSVGGLPGSGVFRFHDRLCLTCPDSYRPGVWRLPRWFYPEGREPLSYHRKMDRWRIEGSQCVLDCAARGQEFILDLAEYPEGMNWVQRLITNNMLD